MKKYLNRNGIPVMLFFVAAILLLSGCSNAQVVKDCLKDGHQFGFWGGLWHGIIAPIDLVIMLFRDDITVFAQNNNGALYAFGFILGSGGWGVIGGHRASKARRKN